MTSIGDCCLCVQGRIFFLYAAIGYPSFFPYAKVRKIESERKDVRFIYIFFSPIRRDLFYIVRVFRRLHDQSRVSRRVKKVWGRRRRKKKGGSEYRVVKAESPKYGDKKRSQTGLFNREERKDTKEKGETRRRKRRRRRDIHTTGTTVQCGSALRQVCVSARDSRIRRSLDADHI